MTASESNRIRESLKRRAWELLTRELPSGWECTVEGEGLVLIHQAGDRNIRKPVSLEALYARVEQYPEQRKEAIYTVVKRILASVHGYMTDRKLQGKESAIYPVLRHHSFISHAGEGSTYVFRPHTSETVIVYALDQPHGYSIIELSMLEEAGWSPELLHEYAMENLRKLEVPVRTQQVGEHFIHFINPADGYAASRVLLDSMLDRYDAEKRGRMLGVAIPHQDVLILADLADDQGAQLLARLTYDFARKGPVPITPIPFLYENGELVSYLVIHNETGKEQE
ncbi:DUF1444 family protein [Brevibacillus migulae]|uniref:DUF1444 family protein n=1 Tax=Brevibacillus migulae TaxID=1644114 RepID=UPI00106E66D5|nr:DUF1444 family protein [Brevibacillus migulae]